MPAPRMAEMIATAGKALYGDAWKQPLAKALGVGERVVRAWANPRDARQPHGGHLADLDALLAEREAAIVDIRGRIYQQGFPDGTAGRHGDADATPRRPGAGPGR